jgi:hypothetical protein
MAMEVRLAVGAVADLVVELGLMEQMEPMVLAGLFPEPILGLTAAATVVVAQDRHLITLVAQHRPATAETVLYG